MPERTCIGCGKKAPQDELRRLRIEGTDVRVDANRSGGRGAWLHPSAGCLEQATRRKAFARAFRRAAVVSDAETFRRELTGSARKD
ncbi:MAG TPA: YlxR family protein [Anaeromyxobacteraceae bacterium]|nr:YlxR family protein [Anaeromyxobacteraceae bacterium]